jgi:hypothetical protein
MTSLVILGRRWFDKRYGNTYHTATIIVDGETVHTSDVTYGYGDAYLQTAAEWLRRNDYPQAGWPLSVWCRMSGIAFTYSAADVSRKRDL